MRRVGPGRKRRTGSQVRRQVLGGSKKVNWGPDLGSKAQAKSGMPGLDVAEARPLVGGRKGRRHSSVKSSGGLGENTPSTSSAHKIAKTYFLSARRRKRKGKKSTTFHRGEGNTLHGSRSTTKKIDLLAEWQGEGGSFSREVGKRGKMTLTRRVPRQEILVWRGEKGEEDDVR